MKCEHCKFFNVVTDENEDYEPLLECRRRAPTITHVTSTGVSLQAWPHVYHDDWCGEFKAKDNGKEAGGKTE